MTSILRRLLAVGAAPATVAPAIPAAPVLAINTVPCNQSEYTKVNWHNTNIHGGTGYHVTCFANGGEYDFTGWHIGDTQWLDQISTGNNRVQWYGDGRWQPEGGIDKRAGSGRRPCRTEPI
ncbi:killer toxin-like protein [Nonomuraea coxensis DSM 45129]|uniref:Killer toxin-like protein n=1 Tax=Nonomuraea coxensis DSM 45129 TaxID=1122611 RepID=A0ABX8U5C0_9ACTN|nr:killer toxin-like protein [Nonomuraea coxensis DSM 45129]